MSINAFRLEMRQWQEEHPLFQSTHPFWRDCFRGRLALDDIRRWGFDVYPFVRDFPRAYIHCASKCDSIATLTFICETIYEETGCGKESEAHSNLFKRFLNSIGPTEEEILGTTMTPAGRAPWEYVGRIAREGTFLEGLAAVGLGVERPLPTFFPMVAKAMMKHYDASEHAVEFFSIHSVADVKHSQIAARIISDLAVTPAQQARVKEIVFHLWDLQKAHLDWLSQHSRPRQGAALAAEVAR
jgi:pyrroloquinoline quinone (PQQ) biosynthesis protein C